MKDRINFNNQNKKKIIIVLIFGLCIYLLYFNDRILIQDIIQKSLSNNSESNITENFNIQKYTDICKNRKTNFYNFRSTNANGTVNNLSETPNTTNCELKCDENQNCYAFFIKDSTTANTAPTCKLYIGDLDPQGKDKNTMDISVNCESGILPTDLLGSTPSYDGYGFINNRYYQNNKDKFKYIDTGLVMSGELKNHLRDMRSTIDTNPANTTNINSIGVKIGDWIDKYKKSTDIDNSERYFWMNTTNNFLDINQTPSNSIEDIKLKDLHKYTQETRNLDNKLEDSNKSGSTNQIFYIILAFVMVFTIILLVLYKFNNSAIISDRFMIFYFIAIVCIFTFIHFILNI